MGGEAFDAFYDGHGCGQPYVRNDTWLRFFGHIADALLREQDVLATQTRQQRDTIAHMERSRFWRLRLQWLRIRNLLPFGR